jgi:hypothetical protein
MEVDFQKSPVLLTAFIPLANSLINLHQEYLLFERGKKEKEGSASLFYAPF